MYIQIYQICFLDFVVHKLCRTLENPILHFVVGISRFVFSNIHEYVNICSNSYYVQQYSLTCINPSISLTPYCVNHASVYSTYSTIAV